MTIFQNTFLKTHSNVPRTTLIGHRSKKLSLILRMSTTRILIKIPRTLRVPSVSCSDPTVMITFTRPLSILAGLVLLKPTKPCNKPSSIARKATSLVCYFIVLLRQTRYLPLVKCHRSFKRRTSHSGGNLTNGSKSSKSNGSTWRMFLIQNSTILNLMMEQAIWNQLSESVTEPRFHGTLENKCCRSLKLLMKRKVFSMPFLS